jgi:hypothetical protein
MRLLCACLVVVGLVLAVGCGPSTSSPSSPDALKGPKISGFTGKLVAGGKQVSFGENDDVMLQVTHADGANSTGIKVNPDGTFSIGSMTVGKYYAVLERPSKEKKGSSRSRYDVPGGFTVSPDTTEITVELGKDFK